MKYFVVTLTRIARAPEAEGLEAPAWRILGESFGTGILLYVGPSEDGAILMFIARAHSQAALSEWLKARPLCDSGLARFDIVEFEPSRLLGLITGCRGPASPGSQEDRGPDGCAFI